MSSNHSVRTVENCSTTTTQAYTLNVLPLSLSIVIIMTQLFNLIVFHLWQNKEPFLQLHVSLASVSLVYGLTTTITPVVRMLPWREAFSENWINLVGRCFEFLSPLTLLTLAAISLDRWMSVEFPSEYRLKISRRKIRWVVLATLVINSLLTVPGLILWWRPWAIHCNKPVQASPMTVGRQIWIIFTGPLDWKKVIDEVRLLTSLQIRIVVIAVKTKTKLMLAKRRASVFAAPLTNNRSGQTIARIVWTSMRASMIVTFIGILTNLSYWVDVATVFRSSTMQRITALLPALQHSYSPLVYLIFYPQFQSVVCLGVGRLIWRQKLVHPQLDPHHAVAPLVSAGTSNGGQFPPSNGSACKGEESTQTPPKLLSITRDTFLQYL
ncbi:hypothetical protein BV898_11766 [Hypsibius exemplaris]|uniref:G-protein coupled receptors family 1 profile domain-containing protein n=1 Tax=Hypsibius exemplaris TaxID=2072580 RepID=A0A1W0WFM0_HYPEX|nr:hypothetical protein BV898_11766 [Hypsibius exemplaris]